MLQKMSTPELDEERGEGPPDEVGLGKDEKVTDEEEQEKGVGGGGEKEFFECEEEVQQKETEKLQDEEEQEIDVGGGGEEEAEQKETEMLQDEDRVEKNTEVLKGNEKCREQAVPGEEYALSMLNVRDPSDVKVIDVYNLPRRTKISLLSLLARTEQDGEQSDDDEAEEEEGCEEEVEQKETERLQDEERVEEETQVLEGNDAQETSKDISQVSTILLIYMVTVCLFLKGD